MIVNSFVELEERQPPHITHFGSMNTTSPIVKSSVIAAMIVDVEEHTVAICRVNFGLDICGCTCNYFDALKEKITQHIRK